MQDALPATAAITQKALRTACPVCEGVQSQVFFELPSVPANCISLWPTRESALTCPRGPIQLALCPDCGAIHNRAFDSSLLEYDTSYENSLHFSPSFQRHAEALADELISRYDLHDKDIVEIGCGKGEFLTMLCSRGANRGLGFDPAYESGRIDATAGQGLRVIHDLYSDAYRGYPADFVCCRHVLEHISDPRSFLAGIQRALGERTASLFFEVPNASFMLREHAIWDVIYDHCSYYADASLTQLFVSSGFDVLCTYETFGGQYLCLEARTAQLCGSSIRASTPDQLIALSRAAEIFAENYREQVERWRATLQRLYDGDQRLIVWGAGAKGITFLNTCGEISGIEYIVDVNPHKHGLFVPGTGQKVVPPEFVKEYKPHLVVIANPNYEHEIKRTVADLGLRPEFRFV
jgi:SAM-dependent methyltransferase